MKKAIFIIGIEIILLFTLYIFVNSKYIEKLPSCWVYNSINLLCPSCGGTRCVTYILKGKWIEAFFSHMVFFIGILYALIINIVYIINLDKEKKILTWIFPKHWYAIIYVIILLIYTIVRNLL